MKILICGSGIAGLTLALWLHRQNHELTIVEKSPALRSEGYMIDFVGSGYDAAERMGILDDLAVIHYQISRLAFLDPEGQEKYSVSYPVFRKIFDDRHFNFMRGELEQVLRSKLPPEIPIKFQTTIQSLQHQDNQVEAELSNGEIEQFDLVVGADGIHSKVRELTFGEERQFKRFLGYYTAAFIIDRPPESFELGNAFYTITVPGKQLGAYPIRGNRVATYFIYKADRVIRDFSTASARSELGRVFGNLKWIVPDLLRDAQTSEIYFDEVSQIEMPGWSRHHVVLVGDACQCVSLAAGQGASLAVAGAYILSEELARHENDLPKALLQYEERVRPAIAKKQQAGRRTIKWFAPDTKLRIAIRDFIMRLASTRWGPYFFKRFLNTESILR